MKVVRGQRRPIALAGVISGLGIWGFAAFGHLVMGLFFAVGILLELVNKLMTEFTLLRSVEKGSLPTKAQFGMNSVARLMGLTVVAVTLTALFWPSGMGVLFGLALFHLILLVMTGIPLLQELRKA